MRRGKKVPPIKVCGSVVVCVDSICTGTPGKTKEERMDGVFEFTIYPHPHCLGKPPIILQPHSRGALSTFLTLVIAT